jgi:hypothetical protein
MSDDEGGDPQCSPQAEDGSSPLSLSSLSSYPSRTPLLGMHAGDIGLRNLSRHVLVQDMHFSPGDRTRTRQVRAGRAIAVQGMDALVKVVFRRGVWWQPLNPSLQIDTIRRGKTRVPLCRKLFTTQTGFLGFSTRASSTMAKEDSCSPACHLYVICKPLLATVALPCMESLPYALLAYTFAS